MAYITGTSSTDVLRTLCWHFKHFTMRTSLALVQLTQLLLLFFHPALSAPQSFPKSGNGLWYTQPGNIWSREWLPIGNGYLAGDLGDLLGTELYAEVLFLQQCCLEVQPKRLFSSISNRFGLVDRLLIRYVDVTNTIESLIFNVPTVV